MRLDRRESRGRAVFKIPAQQKILVASPPFYRLVGQNLKSVERDGKR